MQKRLLGIGLLGALVMSAPAYAVKITIACGALGQEQELCKQGAEAWAKKTGNEVQLFNTPNDSGQQLALFQQMLAAKSADIDVYRIDVIWPSLLANHLIDLTPYVGKEIDQHFKPIVQNDTVNGKLIAIPWFTDAGLLYYRKDLLDKYKQKVPTTWQELADAAKVIQEGERKAGNDKMVGFVFQAKAYEGLTCDALEWVDSFGGGTIVDDSGKVTINNPKAVEAITFAASLIGTVAPKGVLNYQEEEARGVFQSGEAVFMRNWPYAWSLANAENSPIKGKVGVAPLPKGGANGKNTGTLGGWQLSVSKYSKNQAVAADLVKYLAGAEEQKRRAVVGSFNPTIASLYKDPEVVKANPFMASLLDTFTNAVARPSKPTKAKYPQVSSEFYNAVHSTLSGKGSAADNLKKLEGKLVKMSNGGKW